MTWADWFDLKIKDILADFYIIGIIFAIGVVGWFLIQIVNIIKNKYLYAKIKIVRYKL